MKFDIKEDERVYHKKYGNGMIITYDLAKLGYDQVVFVEFDSGIILHFYLSGLEKEKQKL